MAQRVIPCAVTAEYVSGDGVTLGAAGSHDSVVIEYDFQAAGPQWDGVTKYVLWTNPTGTQTNRVNLGADKLVPGYSNVYHASPTADAMCTAGWCEMVVVGVTVDSTTDPATEVFKVRTEPSRFRVLPGSSRDADNEGVAATVADQLEAEINSVYKSLTAEIEGKVNKPAAPLDRNGISGQVLSTLGDGKTKWVDAINVTEEQIDSVLGQHPDWVTTVQDGAISEEKLRKDVAASLAGGGTITPVYVGDFIAYPTMLPSACLRIGNTFYSIDANSNARADQINTGLLHKFVFRYDAGGNLVENAERVNERKLIELGHANSMAYDGESIWIAPIYDYHNYSPAGVAHLYRYSTDFETMEVVPTPTVVHGVTYDWKTGTLYCCHYYYGTVYKWTGSGWVLYTTIDMSKAKESDVEKRSYQDFAVYDGKFYLSSPYCNLYFGALTPGTAEIAGNWRVLNTDMRMMYKMSELEGMEFTPDGHLYAVMYIRINSDYLKNAFIVELYVGTALPISTNIGGPIFDAHQDTLTLSDTTVHKFALGSEEIRSMQQLGARWLTQGRTEIKVPEDNDVAEEDWTVKAMLKAACGETGDDAKATPRRIVFREQVQIEIAGTYEAKEIVISGGETAFYASPTTSPNGRIELKAGNANATAYMLYLRHNGSVKFQGAIPVTFSFPNIDPAEENPWQFINCGSFGGETYCETLPVCAEGYPMMVDGNPLSDRGLYYGNKSVTHINKGAGLFLAYMTGYAGSNRTLSFRVYTGKPTFPGASAVVSGWCRVLGPTGPVTGEESSSVFNLSGGTGYTVTANVSATGMYVEISITLAQESEAITPGTPITMIYAPEHSDAPPVITFQ